MTDLFSLNNITFFLIAYLALVTLLYRLKITILRRNIKLFELIFGLAALVLAPVTGLFWVTLDILNSDLWVADRETNKRVAWYGVALSIVGIYAVVGYFYNREGKWTVSNFGLHFQQILTLRRRHYSSWYLSWGRTWNAI